MKTQIKLIAALLFIGAGANAAELPTYSAKSYPRQFAKGLVRTAESQKFIDSAPRTSFVTADTSVPAKYTVRGNAGPVEDQGQCGSCWDFSLTSVLRGTWMTVGGKDPGRLSFNYLLNCATTMQGCSGGDFSAADYFVSPKGAPAYGSDGDYTGTQGDCQQETPIASTTSYKLLGTNLGQIPTGTPPAFKDIAYVVGVLHQPVSIDINADMDFESYSSGVFNGCNGDTGSVNHMVSIEGYDCETSVDQNGNCVFDDKGNLPAGVGTYLIRNSWGASWGDKGYITMKATDSSGARCDSVATDALYYTVK